MIKEEQFDGFYVAYCPKCRRNAQIPFNKGDKAITCPICGEKIKKEDISKKIEKPINRQVWYSISTEDIFNY